MITRRLALQGIGAMAVGAQGTGFRNQALPFFRAGDTFIINKNGEFLYNGNPTFGNLVSSSTSAPGTDPHGNAYLSGDTVYGTTGGVTYAAQIGWSAGVGSSLTLISFQTSATGAGGPFTRQVIIDGDSTGNLNMSANASFALSVGTGQEIFLGSYLDLPNVTAPGSVSGHTRPLAINGNLHFVSDDGNTYGTGKQRVVSFTGGTQIISLGTFANVTGASFTVGPRQYSIHVRVWLTTSAAAGAPQFQLGLTGAVVSASSFMGTFTQTGATASPLARANSSGLTPGGGLTFAGAGTGQIFDMEFDVTFSTGGTVNLQALTSIAGDNFIINTVYIDLTPES